MNKEQTEKLAAALLDEAVTCAKRNEHEDALDLMQKSVKLRFRDQLEKIIKNCLLTNIYIKFALK